ncbi:MAG: hypothetical protein EA376_10130 [Phycisphaeraceae bacterium]|nr:MAG: hypothetical protein EA376_10130 [Phycisphaeraceae bacterium]
MINAPSNFHLSLLLLASLFLSGCTCNERITVVNETERALDVQVFLPETSYSFHGWRSIFHTCQYEITMAPGESWSTQRAIRSDALSPSVSHGGTATSLRIRPTRSVAYPWRTFSLGGDSPLSARITGDPMDDPDAFAIMVTSPPRDPRPARELTDGNLDRQFERR